MKKEESIFEVYVRTICANCKNKNTNLCCIRKTIDNKAICLYYKRNSKKEKYESVKITTAKRLKPIMKKLI